MKMENLTWYEGLIQELIQTSTDYRQKALLQASADLLAEQSNRLEQMAGELDGTLWSPKGWRE